MPNVQNQTQFENGCRLRLRKVPAPDICESIQCAARQSTNPGSKTDVEASLQAREYADTSSNPPAWMEAIIPARLRGELEETENAPRRGCHVPYLAAPKCARTSSTCCPIPDWSFLSRLHLWRSVNAVHRSVSYISRIQSGVSL